MFQFAICNAIDADIPPIVAYDQEKSEPTTERGGQGSHWAVMVGYFGGPGVLRYLATHGHGEYYVWAATQLQQANFALADTVRTIPREVKVRLAGPGLPDSPSVNKAKRWHWERDSQLATLEQMSSEKEWSVLRKPDTAPREGGDVLQDLAYQLVLVDKP